MKNSYSIVFLTAFLVGVAVISRLIEHPANFAPIAAIALVAAFYSASRFSWIIPLVAMGIADLFIGFYDMKVMLAVYGSYLLIWFLGRWARSMKTKWSLLPATLLGSISFFLITNFSVWAFTPLYEKTADGLSLAYAMGIPFFKWTLAGDVFYLIIFVSVIEIALFTAGRRANEETVELQSFSLRS